MPLFVLGAAFKSDENVNTSVLVSQHIPSVFSIFSVFKSKESFGDTCDAGRDSITLLLLLTNFVRWNPPHFEISINSFASVTAVSSVETDLSKSST